MQGCVRTDIYELDFSNTTWGRQEPFHAYPCSVLPRVLDCSALLAGRRSVFSDSPPRDRRSCGTVVASRLVSQQADGRGNNLLQAGTARCWWSCAVSPARPRTTERQRLARANCALDFRTSRALAAATECTSVPLVARFSDSPGAAAPVSLFLLWLPRAGPPCSLAIQRGDFVPTTKASAAELKPVTPACHWTNGGDKVRIVKCVGSSGETTNGFVWPKLGPVKTPNWTPTPDCESGGLFGWPWGLSIGGGKEPDYRTPWVVFEASLLDSDGKPNIVDLGDKCKAHEGEVIYFGDWWGAVLLIDAGRIAWIERTASGAASSTGWRGAASSTGESGAALTTGEWSNLECGPHGLCATTTRHCYWRIHPGAVLAQRWCDDAQNWHHAIFAADDYEITDGEVLLVEDGELWRE